MEYKTLSQLVDEELERREFMVVATKVARGWVIETLIKMGKCDRCNFCGGYILQDECSHCGLMTNHWK